MNFIRKETRSASGNVSSTTGGEQLTINISLRGTHYSIGRGAHARLRKELDQIKLDVEDKLAEIQTVVDTLEGDVGNMGTNIAALHNWILHCIPMETYDGPTYLGRFRGGDTGPRRSHRLRDLNSLEGKNVIIMSDGGLGIIKGTVMYVKGSRARG